MKKNHVCDQQLIRSFIAGDESCFELLLKRNKTKVFAVIYSVVHDRYIAEEIFQETFIKVFHHLRDNRYQDDDKFAHWVVRIARNLSIDYLRKTKIQPVITDSQGNNVFDNLKVHEESVEDQMTRKEQITKVRKLIMQLPEDQREVLIMRHYGNFSFKEIAKITNVSINTALGRMRYAVMNLKKMMEKNSVQI